MKKLLLSIVTIMLSAGLMAQSPFLKQATGLEKVMMQKAKAVAEYFPEFSGEANPYVSNVKDADIVIGQTRYDLASNAAVPPRIYAHPDGTIGAVWVYGMNDPSFADRGTGYNYHNGTSWGPAPTARIESARTGWANYQPYGENGEIVCTHTGGTQGLLFSWRENKGTGTWNTFYLQGPAGFQDLLWPRMITSGVNHTTIHVIAALDASYQGLEGALLYSRSTDGGQTWNPQNEILPGLAAGEIHGVGGDVYAWAAPVGETIAFIVGDFLADGIVLKSTDNGDTWESMKYYEAPIPAFGNEVPLPKHGGIDGYQHAVLDDQGRVHVAVGRMIHSADGSGGATNYYPYSNGLLYWNETMPPMDSTALTDSILNLVSMNPMYLLAEVYDNGVDELASIAKYQASLTSMPQLVFDHNSKILYAFYSAVTLGFVSSDDYNYRHIWMRFSEDYGQSWSPQVDLTSDIFHMFTECVWPSASPTVTNKLHVIYQSDNIPGNATRFEEHAINDNNIVYLPLNLVVGMTEKPASVLTVDQLWPNPATTETQIVVNVNKTTKADISIVNLVGKQVYFNTYMLGYGGPHKLRFDLTDLNSGIYFVNVKAGSNTITKKLIVQ